MNINKTKLEISSKSSNSFGDLIIEFKETSNQEVIYWSATFSEGSWPSDKQALKMASNEVRGAK